jgi:membrane carboxypeptidase/penicillin-binding protein PbpC
LLRTSTEREVNAALDLKRQLLLERVLAVYLKTKAGQSVNNASMLLIDSSTMPNGILPNLFS